MTLEDEANQEYRELTRSRTVYVDEDQLLFSGLDRTIIVNPAGQNYHLLPNSGSATFHGWVSDRHTLIGIIDNLPKKTLVLSDVQGNQRRLHSRSDIRQPTLNPKRDTIAFLDKGELYTMGLSDASPRRIAADVTSFSWTDDGKIGYQCKDSQPTVTDKLGLKPGKIGMTGTLFCFVPKRSFSVYSDSSNKQKTLWQNKLNSYGCDSQQIAAFPQATQIIISPNADLLVAYCTLKNNSEFDVYNIKPGLGTKADGALSFGIRHAKRVFSYRTEESGIIPCFSPDSSRLAILYESGELHMLDLYSLNYHPVVDLKKLLPDQTHVVAWRPR